MASLADYMISGVTLGQGTFGTVHLATHVPTGRQVALKTPTNLNATMTLDLSESAQFEKEARLWQSLCQRKIQGIVELYEYGTRPYTWLAMEYMSGGTLRERLRGKRASIETSVELISSLLVTLHEIHLLGVIHRDIKPENILFDASGAAKLTDFGLGKTLLTVSSRSSTLGGFRGTLLYASPEQFAGKEFGDVDRRSDLYQMGCLLYELLTGRPPYDSDPVRLMYQKLHEQPVPPSNVRRAVPGWLDEVVLKSLQIQKEARYRDCGEFLDALHTKEKTENRSKGTPVKYPVYTGNMDYQKPMPRMEVGVRERSEAESHRVQRRPTPAQSQAEDRMTGVVYKRVLSKKRSQHGLKKNNSKLTIATILIAVTLAILTSSWYVWVTSSKSTSNNEPKINGYFSNTQHGYDYNLTWDVTGQSGSDISIESFEIQIIDNAGTIIARTNFSDSSRIEHTYFYKYPGQGLTDTGGNITIIDNNENAKLDVGDKIIIDPDGQGWRIGFDINFLYKSKQLFTTEIP